MNNSNNLKRLLQGASRAPQDESGIMNPAMATRVLAHWRAGDVDEWAPLLVLFRRAVLYSALVMMLSLGCIWVAGRSESASQTALANYAIRIQLPP